ncbi:uncharacterized protein [Penaeus vannamei]|uniref:uncharacterized protein n=1 Tax=Penaeus vannamei TaxID=6689 RepID=UPI00387F8A67
MKFILRFLCLALTTCLLPAVDSSLFKNMSPADVHNMGRFVSDLAQGLQVNVVALCMDESEVYHRLMSAFIRNLVFFVPCDAPTPPPAHEPPRRPPAAPRTGPGVEPSFAHTHAELHLTSRALFGPTVTRAREKYRASRGRAWQVILGEDLLASETGAGEGVAAWMVASYHRGGGGGGSPAGWSPELPQDHAGGGAEGGVQLQGLEGRGGAGPGALDSPRAPPSRASSGDRTKGLPRPRHHSRVLPGIE